MTNKTKENIIVCAFLVILFCIMNYLFLVIAVPRETARQKAVHDYNCQHYADYAKRFCGE